MISDPIKMSDALKLDWRMNFDFFSIPLLFFDFIVCTVFPRSTIFISFSLSEAPRNFPTAQNTSSLLSAHLLFIFAALRKTWALERVISSNIYNSSPKYVGLLALPTIPSLELERDCSNEEMSSSSWQAYSKFSCEFWECQYCFCWLLSCWACLVGLVGSKNESTFVVTSKHLAFFMKLRISDTFVTTYYLLITYYLLLLITYLLLDTFICPLPSSPATKLVKKNVAQLQFLVYFCPNLFSPAIF